MKILFIAQIFGLISLVTNIVSIIKNKKKSILIYNGISNVACIIQYILLGTFTGAISSVIATLRNIVFSRYKNKIPLYILILYFLVAILFNLPYCNGIMSLIPLLNILVYGYGIWQTNIATLKIINIITGIAGMIYDIYALAYVSFINQLLSFIAGIISYTKYKKSLKKNIKVRKTKKKNMI